MAAAAKALFVFKNLASQSDLHWPAKNPAEQKPHWPHPFSKNAWQVPGEV